MVCAGHQHGVTPPPLECPPPPGYCVQDTDSVVSSLEQGLGAIIHVAFLAFYL